MGAIVPIPTTRVSDILARQRLQTQLQSDQLDLLRLQDQLSTGKRITVASQDAPAALRAMSIQRLLERKDQVRKNITANELYLKTTDTALSNSANLLSEIRASALAVVGSSSSDTQRLAVGLEIDNAIQELIDSGNQQVNGRYLFAGSQTAQLPFERVNDSVRYNGNATHLESYGDVNLLFETNLTGDQAFGGMTSQVIGAADFNRSLSRDTKLSDLHDGVGVHLGSISISDGLNTSLVDLSRASTIGDVVDKLEAGAPLARAIRVDITATGLNLQIDSAGGGNLLVQDIGDGSTAKDLGILRTIPAGVAPVIGGDLDPRVTLTTRLDDILGSRARAFIAPSGANNNLVVTATNRGAQFNSANITFVDGGLGVAGNESVAYNSGTNTLTVTIESGVSTANQIISAINAEGTFNATLDAHELENDGSGYVQATAFDPLAAGSTAGGSGIELDLAAGLTVTNGGSTNVIDLSGAETIEDLLNAFNGSGLGLSAEINSSGNGINVLSKISGQNFQIGENGGQTATHLGIRSLTAATQLNSLNHGRGVQTTTGTDMVIERRDGTRLELDLDGAQSIGDVLDLINNHPSNLNPATRVVARLARTGNGIELVNDDPTGAGELRVLRVPQSQAAEDLGLIPVAANGSAPANSPAVASATLNATGANNDIVISGLNPGTQLNGVAISFVDTGLGVGNETVTYNAGAGTLVFDITSGATTANALVNLVNSDATTSAVFSGALAPADGAPNNGTGVYTLAPTANLSGGTAQTLTGRDVNPQEVSGVFNALLRLRAALNNNDSAGIQRGIELLDDSAFKINFARADSGARQQALDLLKQRLESEDTELKQARSNDIDADFTTVVSELAARQAALQAALQTTAQTFKLSLLDYL
jgi:flagellin-like hook-associated protein FlgL